MRPKRWLDHEITVVGLNNHLGCRYLVPFHRDSKPTVRSSPAPRSNQHIGCAIIFEFLVVLTHLIRHVDHVCTFEIILSYKYNIPDAFDPAIAERLV